MAPRRVEPHLYADTPVFREMLYERDGRYPGTPEGEEELPEVILTQEVPEDVQDAQAPAEGLLNRVVPVALMNFPVVMPVFPETERSAEKTQAMPLPLFVDHDDEA
jgi:hypothetical protein